MDLQFLVNLIIVAKDQTDEALAALGANCSYVDNDVWIYEGDMWYLQDFSNVKCRLIGEGVVPTLGDMNQEELIQLCEDVFSVDVRKVKYQRKKKRNDNNGNKKRLYGVCKYVS